MKKDKNSIIDEKASEILRSHFPGADWQLYELKPDIAIDYVVEFVEDGERRGPKFAIQQKGQKKPNLSKDKRHVLFPLETKHLAYYYDVESLPVFLIVVDVTTRASYWLFVQGYVRELLQHLRWRTQKSITLRIPTSNLLSTADKFGRAVAEAAICMAELRPAAVDGAIRADQDRWESLDPRFAIKLTATQDNKHYQLEPKEPVTVMFSLNAPTDEAQQKARDLFRRGLPVPLKPGEIVAKGSPLIEEITRLAETMSFAKTLDGSLLIRSENRSSGVQTYRCALPVKATGGPDEVRLESGGAGMPLHLTTTITREGSQPFHMSLSLRQWAGQPLSALLMFEEVHAILSALVADEDLVTEFIFPPHSPATGTLANAGFASICKNMPVDYILLLKKAKIVSEFFSLNLVAPPAITPKDQDSLDILYSLATSGRYTRSEKGATITGIVGKTSARALVEKTDEAHGKATVSWANAHEDFPLFNKVVRVQPLSIELTNANLQDRQAVMAHIYAPAAQTVRVIIKSGPDSQMTYRLDGPPGIKP